MDKSLILKGKPGVLQSFACISKLFGMTEVTFMFDWLFESGNRDYSGKNLIYVIEVSLLGFPMSKQVHWHSVIVELRRNKAFESLSIHLTVNIILPRKKKKRWTALYRDFDLGRKNCQIEREFKILEFSALVCLKGNKRM